MTVVVVEKEGVGRCQTRMGRKEPPAAVGVVCDKERAPFVEAFPPQLVGDGQAVGHKGGVQETVGGARLQRQPGIERLVLTALHLQRHGMGGVAVLRGRPEDGAVGGKVEEQIVHLVLPVGAQGQLLQVGLGQPPTDALLLLLHPLGEVLGHPPSPKARHHQDAERKQKEELSRGDAHRSERLDGRKKH